MAYNSLMVFHRQRQSKLAAGCCSPNFNVDIGRANVGRFSLMAKVELQSTFVVAIFCSPINLCAVQRQPDGTGHRLTSAKARRLSRPELPPLFLILATRVGSTLTSSRVPIAAKLVANMLAVSGVDRVRRWTFIYI